MPLPTSYTETDLAAYMLAELRDVAAYLGWDTPTVPGSVYAEMVYAVAAAFGVTDVADVTDMAKLRAVARVEAWRAATGALAAHFDFDADGQSFKRSQLRTGAEAALLAAEMDAARYGVGPYVVTVDRVTHPHDPYTYRPDEYRTVP